MRIASAFLVLAFLCGGPSLAGSFERGGPGVGSFSYNGAPVAAAREAVVVAAVR